MKMLLMLSVLLTGVVSFAGPEEHIQAQVCYTIAAADQARAHSELPLELCFEKLNVHLSEPIYETEETIEVYSYFSQYSKYLNTLKLTSLIRSTEDEYSYKAESVLVNRSESHCDDGVKITLQMDGRVDIAGYGDISAQNVTLTQVTQADTCHSKYETNVFKYVRTR